MSHHAAYSLPAPALPVQDQWAQTERKSHEAWARLVMRKPRAAALAHHLLANLGDKDAVVISQKVLARLMGSSVETVKRAVRDLVAERWIEVVRLGKGKEVAYVVNERVRWDRRLDDLTVGVFSANVVADHEDQEEALLGNGALRQLPVLFPGERQLPTGAGDNR